MLPRRDPDVIRRDGGSLSSQLQKQPGVMMGRILVRANTLPARAGECARLPGSVHRPRGRPGRNPCSGWCRSGFSLPQVLMLTVQSLDGRLVQAFRLAAGTVAQPDAHRGRDSPYRILAAVLLFHAGIMSTSRRHNQAGYEPIHWSGFFLQFSLESATILEHRCSAPGQLQPLRDTSMLYAPQPQGVRP